MHLLLLCHSSLSNVLGWLISVGHSVVRNIADRGGYFVGAWTWDSQLCFLTCFASARPEAVFWRVLLIIQWHLIVARSWYKALGACHAAAQLNFHGIWWQTLLGESVIWLVCASSWDDHRGFGLIELGADIEFRFFDIEAHWLMDVGAGAWRHWLWFHWASLFFADDPLEARLRDRHVLVKIVFVRTRT